MKAHLLFAIAVVLESINVLSAKDTGASQRARFCIARDGHASTILVDRNDRCSVLRAAKDLSEDIRRVTGTEAGLSSPTPDPSPVGRGDSLSREGDRCGVIIVGTIGQSRLIDSLVERGKIDVSRVRGQWESYLIDVVDGNLVIAGSDHRGTIYGIYTISERIGVSPWYWWADVPVPHQSEVWYDGGRIEQRSPSVRYRGIFINDEDWGLKPWASTTFEPELSDIGPRTYARVCELLLRLKANMLAPAMHSCTGAFYSHPESKAVCDSFGIVITTSHCEPLLINTAAKSEWDVERDGDWNYKTNRDAIMRKWDQRLAEAAHCDNIYTTAMRGLHDAGLRGNLPMSERVPLIEQVFADQRQLLEKHTGEKATEIPQIFVPYKETMDIYENGLRVPDDITLVWVDDNYGYMKRVSSPEEQRRSGGAGVYYHISYLGAPHDYLWINTTPPVLMYEELRKAYAHGADRYWLLNVGDIKPMELGIQTFMDMAWDINAFDFERANAHQAEYLARLFPGVKADFQGVLDTYYRLAWSRKPEFMGWEYEWDDPQHTGLHDTEFSFRHYGEAQRRLADYARISDEVEGMGSSPSLFELLQFPVQAAYQMNRKFLMAQLNHEMVSDQRYAEANWAAVQMQMACDSIDALNRRYNEQLDGKWRGMMNVPPGLCALYQNKPQVTYTDGAGETPVDLTWSGRDAREVGVHVVDLTGAETWDGAPASIVHGLGYDWDVVHLTGGDVSYALPAIAADTIEVLLYAVPFWPLYAGTSNRIGVSLDGGAMQVFENRFKEYSRTWKDQVMRNGIACRLRFHIDSARATHTLTLHTIDAGQMVQRIIIDWGGLQPSYIGPEN